MLAGAPVTAQNWRASPAITEVRRIVAEVERRSPELRASARTRDCGSAQLEVTTFFGDGGRPARRSVTLGSSDSVQTVTATYDPAGEVRFVFVEVGAVNDTHAEYRYYFDVLGRRLWRDVRESGPGYGFSPKLFEKRFGPGFSKLADVKC